jgi:muramoyltetrapeptide carboxypeptidase
MLPRIIPPFLKPGDKIAIAATARKVSKLEMQPAIEIFSGWGLEVVMHPDLFAEENQFAGPDALRAGIFQYYLDDDSIKAIICARGGYGTVRMIDRLDFSRFNHNPKWIIGYSDVTVLHNHIHTHTNVCSLHATMPINMQQPALSDTSINQLYNSLFGISVETIIPPHPLNKYGHAKGQLVGGNLSVLFSLLGSTSDTDTAGKILFIEDLDEYLYHIDRMMQALKRAGKLSNLAGLVVGGMSDMRDNVIPFGKTAEEIIREAIGDFDYPVCFNYPAGHLPVNYPLHIGMIYELTSRNHAFQLHLSPLL